MLDIKQIKAAYPTNIQQFDRHLLREYLQYQILSLIFQHPVSKKLSFLGGTNLRIVHGLPRFSEEIDFDNKQLSEAEFNQLAEYLQKELMNRGYQVENRIVNKGAFHCHIKFPQLLYQHGLAPTPEQKILIQVDTFDQGVVYEPEIFILNKFEFFDQILVTPKSVILAQKLWTITQRNRLKGRDFFDTMFLLQSTRPDLDFLEAKFQTRDIKQVFKIISDYLQKADFSYLAKDVQPFLQNPAEADKIKLFPEFLRQQLS